VIVLGRACLIIALGLAAWGAFAALYGTRAGNRRYVESARRAMYAMTGVLLVAFAVLEVAFLRTDLSFQLVGSHSSTTTPTFYRATAIWSSQEGSLLLWVTLLALWSSAVLLVVRRSLPEITPYAIAVLFGFAGFFLVMTTFLANPFGQASPAPAEGVGLNPLLRHPSMMIHPPMLYSGYTLFTIPFAFAIGALVTRRAGADWIRATRRFSLAAWTCLGIGILLGARWSYSELGWGGYWAWDPVENASLLPWLTGTALLHSVQIQEKRGMLKVWNASLVLATGILAVLGTFLVRSGILDSIHAFGASTLGTPFLIFIAVLILGSVYLVATRARDLRSEHRLDSLFSREAAFLLNNLVLVGMAFVVFWGTFFPLISEAITGEEASVGPPWFDRYIVPLAIVLVFLTGIGPVIAWRRQTWATVRRSFLIPLVCGAVALVALLALGVERDLPALLFFFAAAFTIAALAQEFWRGTAARRAMTGDPWPVALGALVRRNRRRYGGYVVHLGIVVMFLGVAASSTFQHARDVRLQVGQSARIDGYDVRYVRATSNVSNEKITFGSVLAVSKDGKPVTTLRPSRNYFPSPAPFAFGPVGRFFEGEATSEVGLRAGALKDLWAAMTPDLSAMQKVIDEGDQKFEAAADQLTTDQANGFLAATIFGLARSYAEDPPPATFRLISSPMVTWIWTGGLILLGGALIALWPAPRAARRRITAAEAARLGQELSRA
jgi:cytochrome c-type biogenesis protein CcmF